MPRDHSRVNVTLWTDPDFRRLPPAAQHLYLLLWTSPALSYCGVHDWRPGRLAALSHGFTAEHIVQVGHCLQARHFLVIDEDTEEALIRSWARFDGLMKQPRMAVSFATAYAQVSSEKLRTVLVAEVKKIRQESPTLSCWNDKRVSEVLSHESVSAKGLSVPQDPFGDGFGDGFALGLPQTRDGVSPRVYTPPTPAPTPTPTPYSRTSSASASADAERESIEEEFDEWYAAYPRKRGKGQAIKAYRGARKKVDAETLLKSIKQQAAALVAKGVDFAPYPATWLNGERWADEPDSNVRQFPQHERPADVPDDALYLGPLPKGVFDQ